MIIIQVSAVHGLLLVGATTRDLRGCDGNKLVWRGGITPSGRRGAWQLRGSEGAGFQHLLARAHEIADGLHAAGHQTRIETVLTPPAGSTSDLREPRIATKNRPDPARAPSPTISRDQTPAPAHLAPASSRTVRAGPAQKTATHREQHRRNPRSTLRRIHRLRSELNRIRRKLTGEAYATPLEHHGQTVVDERGHPVTRPNPPLADLRQRLIVREQLLLEKLAYWEHLVAEGIKVWRCTDFDIGDFALYHGTWYEVVRVNDNSITIPAGQLCLGQQIVRRQHTADQTGRPPAATTRVEYYDITGRMSVHEADTHFPLVTC
ncbi:hypothetical protein [Nonomuraea sp. KM90]|uniref:hypothetical protein n=1 Tax=Nonomuraea sp. KM90 TaxID=3457428 RepID=UPI003FCE6E0C